MGCNHNQCAGCGGSSCCTGCHQPREIRLCRREAEFLLRFAELPFLPAARFQMNRYGEAPRESDTLAPVFLCSPQDSLDAVRATAAVLNRLAALRLITVSFTEPLQHFNYAEYENSPAFAAFRAQAGGFAVPEIEHGSMALTALGQDVIDELELTILPREDD